MKRRGLSVRAFCLAEGVPSFYWWRRELPRRDQPKPAFLPVHVLADKAESPAGSIEVVLANGKRSRFPGVSRAGSPQLAHRAGLGLLPLTTIGSSCVATPRVLAGFLKTMRQRLLRMTHAPVVGQQVGHSIRIHAQRHEVSARDSQRGGDRDWH
ncbi:IS66 family insertion sequence element accessory protein TnpA, partial [Singulisphaera acidiphila]|uniref:IS66 family insertion sequence element accessory protein TnpA n=1 Tax=Singulisphaera acidiphila TaxID=466153 RepID=UPI0005C63BCA